MDARAFDAEKPLAHRISIVPAPNAIKTCVSNGAGPSAAEGGKTR
jgi:hypothetical protein